MAGTLRSSTAGRKCSAGQSVTRRLLLIGIGVCATLLLLELGYRVYHLAIYGTPLWQGVDDLGRDPALEDRLNPIALDARLGWRSASNYRFDGQRRNLDGSTYTAHVSFTPDGFRLFGNLATARRKVFVIGDSYTQAVQTSDGATYYALLGNDLDAEMFVYGAGGFGTLQEYMILDQYLDTIRPDLIVWQYCSNDFVNNSFELERASYANNNRLVRPYLQDDGSIMYALPTPDRLGLRTFWGLRSRVVYALLTRWDSFETARHETDTVETAIERLGFEHPGFRRAVDTTSQIMGMVRQRAGGLPILAFSCDDGGLYTQAFERISSANGVQFQPDVARAVTRAEAAGESVRTVDFHWNERGHSLIAAALARYARLGPQVDERGQLLSVTDRAGGPWPG